MSNQTPSGTVTAILSAFLFIAPLFFPCNAQSIGKVLQAGAVSGSRKHSGQRHHADGNKKKAAGKPAGAHGAARGQDQQKAAGVSGMNATAVGNLPLNGRSTSQVAELVPGVIKARTQASHNGVLGFGTQLVIFGGRPRQNDSRVDGISVNDYANGPMGSAIGIALGVDAVGQLTVLTRNDQARIGRCGGGCISTSTRSGTSRFHGSVFEYFRNSALDARNYFDIAKPPFRRNQFGAVLGGPLWGNRTFFFADYEGIRQSQGVSNVAVVPSAAARQGILSTGNVTVDPAIQPVLKAFYPLPNDGLLGSGDEGVYLSSGQKVTPGNHFSIQVNRKFSGKDSLHGLYLFDKGRVTGPTHLTNRLHEYDSRENFVALSETHTFSPRLTNSVRFGVYRMTTNAGGTFALNNPFVADTSFGAIPGHTAPSIHVASLMNMAGGLGGADIFHFHWTSIQAYDDVSWIRGRHALQFGFALERMLDNIASVKDPNGSFTFNSLADFLTNQPFSFSATIPGSSLEREFRQTRIGAYAQDNWLFRRNLSLHLGLRYDMVTVPGEVHGRLASLRNLTDPSPAVGPPLFSNPTLRNFDPRVGFAWDPFGKGKTVVSAGFGVFDVLPLLYEIQLGEIFSAPFTRHVNLTNLPAGTYPTDAFQIAQASTSGDTIGYFQPHPKRNYIMQWNLTVQQELPRKVNLEVGYVGSRGIHNIFRVDDADIVLPTLTSRGYLWPSPAGSGARLNPYAGDVSSTFWISDSYYDALVLEVQSPVGHSYQINGSYTFGKSIDTSSASMGGKEYTNAISSPLWFDTRLNRGLSDFNVAQDLKIIASWQIPSPKRFDSFLRWPLSGWRIGGVFEASSGLPFTPGIAGDPLGVKSTDPGIDVPNVLGGPGCGSLVNPGNPVHYIRTQCFAPPNPITLHGNLGRNTLIGPGLVNLDFSLFKNNYVKRISDAFNVQFRAEIFNICNRPNFDPPLDFKNIFDGVGTPIASGGLIDSTQTSSRQTQFALRIIW